MKNPLARCRQAGSFIAGLFIGLSIMVPVFAMVVANPSDWQTFLVFGAPIILALGITLQVFITAKPRHRRTIDTKLRPFPIRLTQVIHEQCTSTSQRRSLTYHETSHPPDRPTARCGTWSNHRC